jgi:hypothetical protein
MFKFRQYSYIIALVAIFFILPARGLAAEKIIINEIFSDPAGNDLGLEWIELYNPGSQSVDLGGWQIGMGQYFTFPQTYMPANSYLVVHWRADGQNNAGEIFTGQDSIDTNLGNSSGFIVLFSSAKRSKETIIDYVEYGKENQTWEAAAVQAKIWTKGQFLPATEANKNQSLGQIVDGQDGDKTSDWQIFSQPTPGQPNHSDKNNNSVNNITIEQTASQQNNLPLPSTAGSLQVALQQITDDPSSIEYGSKDESSSSSPAQEQKQESIPAAPSKTVDPPSQTSKSKIFLSLGAVTALAAASGAFFMYWRKKKSVDSEQKPMLPF